jgi:hypothetical protein
MWGLALIHTNARTPFPTQVVGAGDVLFGATVDGRAVAPAGRMSQMTYVRGSACKRVD